MILAKEIDGELWVKASDHHRLIKDAQRTWVSLTDEQVIKTFNAICNGKPFNVERILELHRAIEAGLRSKNA